MRGKPEHNLKLEPGRVSGGEPERHPVCGVAQQTGSGYFKNFGKTRREGVQASVDGHIKRVSGGLDYTFLEATYQSTETLDGTANNTSDIAVSGFPGVGGVITVHPVNRIPLFRADGEGVREFSGHLKTCVRS